ncbi:uncharacterized protein METZ01_LOCUS225347, partial [marine metagenome]
VLLAGGVRSRPPTSIELEVLDERDTSALTRRSELSETDVFFVALHGGSGEDGTVQGLLEVAGVTYTGSDRLGCGLAMDKEVSKRLFRQAGVPTPDWLVGPQSVAEVERHLGLPVIIKAAGGGSSLRLLLAHDLAELEEAIAESQNWNDLVLFERYHVGRELTVAVLGGRPLPVGEIIPSHDYFDYECKYQTGLAEEVFPADISQDLAGRLQDLSAQVDAALRLRDYCRVDFIVDENDDPWCLEVNSLPGMTPNSLVPKAALAAGISFPELCDQIVSLARNRSLSHSV